MGKRTKTLLILVAILVVVVAALVIVLVATGTEEDTSNGISLFEANRSDIEYIKVESDGDSATFELKDEHWVCTDKDDFPVNEERIDKMQAELKDFYASREVKYDESKLEEYGLKDPISTISVANKAGDSITFSVGAENPVTEEYYVLADGKIYMVDEDLADPFNYNLSAMHEVKAIPEGLTSDTITYLKFEPAGGGDVLEIINKPDGGGEFYTDYFNWFTKDEEGNLMPLSYSGAQNYLKAVDMIRTELCANYNPSEEELAELGFDDPDVLTIEYTVKDTSGASVTNKQVIYIGDADMTEEEQEENRFEVTFQDVTVVDIGETYIMLGGDKGVYTTDTYNLEAVKEPNMGEINSRFLHYIKMKTVDAIDMTLEGKSYKLQLEHVKEKNKRGREVDVTHCKVNGKYVGDDEFEAFYNDMLSIYTSETKASVVEGSPYITMVFKRNTGDEFATMRLEIYEYDNNFYRASFMGDDSLLVSVKDINNLVDDFNEMLESELER